MNFQFAIRIHSLFRWAGVIEGVLLVVAIHQLGVGVGFIAFVLVRFIVTLVLEILWAKLEQAARRL